MINRNWVLKRKRRKLPYGPDASNGKEDGSAASGSVRNTSSVKSKLKSEIINERFSSKKKGNDGVSYYFSSYCLGYSCSAMKLQELGLFSFPFVLVFGPLICLAYTFLFFQKIFLY